jgi:hypothetical protein
MADPETAIDPSELSGYLASRGWRREGSWRGAGVWELETSGRLLIPDHREYQDDGELLAEVTNAITASRSVGSERAVRAQFGEGFRPFADLRRRRNELEDPHVPGDAATADEAEQAVEVAERLIAAPGQLLGQLSFFAPPQRP